jgi:anti-anti-sigma factor
MPTARTDLSGVSFLSAAGLGVLGRTHQRTRTDGTSLRVVTAVGCVHLVLHLTDLDRRTHRRGRAILLSGTDSFLDYSAPSEVPP